jgi:hypothetical protein
LQEDFGRDGAKLGSFDVSSEIRKRLMEMRYRGCEVRENGRTTVVAGKEGASVHQNAVHVMNQFVRGADLGRCAETGEFRRRVTKRFLGPISECGEKMAK